MINDVNKVKKIGDKHIFVEWEDIHDKPIDNGEGTNSIIMGYNTQALSEDSMASGCDTIAGIKGYYYSNVDFSGENPIITLTKEQGVEPTEPFIVSYEAGDIISMTNGSKFYDCATILEVNDNKITVDTLPFNSITWDTDYDDNTFYVIAKPLVGYCLLGKYANAEGEGSQALEKTSHAEGYYCVSYGQYAHTEGVLCTAAYSSHAEGYKTNSPGFYSHSEGMNTTASGKHGSHAEGYGVIASGEYGSHAEGYYTRASGKHSHTEGDKTYAIGDTSHSEGEGTYASSHHQHVQGKYNILDEDNIYAHIVGNGIPTKRSNAHTLDWNGNAWFAGNISLGSISNKLIISAGVGEQSLQLGHNSNAVADMSVALNQETLSGVRGYKFSSISFGNAISSGNYGPCTINLNYPCDYEVGDVISAVDSYAHLNCSTITSIDSTKKIITVDKLPFNSIPSNGYNCIFVLSKPTQGNYVLGLKSTAIGYRTVTIGNSSFAEGEDTIASGSTSHAEGRNSEAIGAVSHAEGYKSKSIGAYSHTEGSNTSASGQYSHAENRMTQANGEASHAEGTSTRANGLCAHAEGKQTFANGDYSHSEGELTYATSNHQHVQGKFNVIDNKNTYAHIVGNGESNTERSNAHTLDWNGNAWFSGDVTVGSDNKKLLTEDDLENLDIGVGATTDTGGEIFNDYANNVASGQYSHAEGQNSIASGQASHSEGYKGNAIGICSHAEGYNSYVFGAYAHGEGCDCNANGLASHAEGYDTTTYGRGAHAEGLGTIASADYQHVQGRFNINDSDKKYAHIVGNGIKDPSSDAIRSNAYTLDWDGNAWYAGIIEAGRDTTDEDNDLVLVSKGYLKSYIESIKSELKHEIIEEMLSELNGDEVDY